jgi:hypothetical protein
MFSKKVAKKDGLCPSCKLCNKLKNQQYYKQNKDILKENVKNYRKNNPDKIKELNDNYYKQNSISITNQNSNYYYTNSDTIKIRQKIYNKLNPGKINASSAKRHSIKLQATPKTLTKEQWKEIEAFYILAKKMEQENGIEYHVDHICPLQGKTVCGLHVPWNLQVITAEENLHKHNKLLLNGEL